MFSFPLVQPCAEAFPTGIETSGQQSSEMKAQALNQPRAEKLGAWHRASSERIDNAQGNDFYMDCCTPTGSESDDFRDPHHGKAQTQQFVRRVFEESYEVMKCFNEESISTLFRSVRSPSSCVQGWQRNPTEQASRHRPNTQSWTTALIRCSK